MIGNGYFIGREEITRRPSGTVGNGQSGDFKTTQNIETNVPNGDIPFQSLGQLIDGHFFHDGRGIFDVDNEGGARHQNDQQGQ
jgi:hypothetical protein